MQQAPQTQSDSCVTTLGAALSLILLGACALQDQTPSTDTRSLMPHNQTGPDDAPPDTCWGQTATPAVIETVTERVLIEPADISPDGLIRQPARYQNHDRVNVVRPRQISWHQIICETDMTVEFVTTLQRALAARDLYSGPISGQLDRATQDAIALYQSEQDLPGYALTVVAARRLGLVAVPRGDGSS